MVKGWKLNPEWIRLYEERKEKEHQRRLERIRFEMKMEQVSSELKMQRRRITHPFEFGVLK